MGASCGVRQVESLKLKLLSGRAHRCGRSGLFIYLNISEADPLKKGSPQQTRKLSSNIRKLRDHGRKQHGIYLFFLINIVRQK